MKARVALVNPPYPPGAPRAVFISLGISYLAAVLEKNDYDVEVIDCQIGKTEKELESKFTTTKPDVVGVTSATLTYLPALDVVRTAKRALPNCVTMMGGPHVTVMDEETIRKNPEVDIVVRSEGERTILELADLVSSSMLARIGDVAGITFRKNDEIYRNPDRPFIEDIDSLPHPAHKHFKVGNYKISGKTYLPIITSR